jgi:hypothetical protein
MIFNIFEEQSRTASVANFPQNSSDLQIPIDFCSDPFELTNLLKLPDPFSKIPIAHFF